MKQTFLHRPNLSVKANFTSENGSDFRYLIVLLIGKSYLHPDQRQLFLRRRPAIYLSRNTRKRCLIFIDTFPVDQYKVFIKK